MANFQAPNLSVEVHPNGIAELWFDVPDHTHNVLNPAVFADLEAAFDHLALDRSVQLLVIASRKPAGFLAGADLHEFTKVQGATQAKALSESGQKHFDQLAQLPFPSVAVIHGVCLGGGLELALACDYRVVVDQPTTQIGLPEIKLGLLPAWGGTQRLPRVIGIERALAVILQGKQLDARTAFRWGLADAVEKTQAEALAYVANRLAPRKPPKRPKTGLPLRTWRQRMMEGHAPGRWLLFRIAETTLRRKVPDDMPAPLEALEAVQFGLRRGLLAGLEYERSGVARLATTSACRNLITLFLLMEQAKKAPDESAVEGTPAIRRVGVVGAGAMGAGIAQLAALKGFEVVVQEVNETALAAGVKKIEDLFQKVAARGVMSAEEARDKFNAIGKTTTWEGFGNVDLVIEAVIEDLDKKREVFRELETRTPPGTILATNTSSLAVTDLQQGRTHPERVGGLHFFNPVHKMPLIEVVRAPATTDPVARALTAWAAAVGKTPVVVKDSPGFVVNRILMPYVNEAVVLAAQQMPVESLDAVMKRFGMPMGPFELLDQVGLDVSAHIGRTMQPHYGTRFTPNPTFERMAEKGWLGQKTGIGFYRYQGKKKTLNPGALTTFAAAAGDAAHVYGHRPVDVELHEARDRMVLLMVNEAAACLGEGLAATAEAIDLAMILGTGWAPHRGGPLHYADDRGIGAIVKTLDGLAKLFGPRFEPCAELRRRAESGERFYAALGPAGANASAERGGAATENVSVRLQTAPGNQKK